MNKLPKSFTVHVNKTNIRRGKKGDAANCAISKAIAREIQAKLRGCGVEVGGGDDIQIINKNGITSHYKGSTKRVVKRVSNFIDNFDTKKSLVKPTKFRVVLNYSE